MGGTGIIVLNAARMEDRSVPTQTPPMKTDHVLQVPPLMLSELPHQIFWITRRTDLGLPHATDYDSNRHHSRWDSWSRSRSPHQSTSYSPNSSPRKHVGWNLYAPPTPVAQLSLLDSINQFLDD
jgi:hypothetical protein